MIVRIRLSERFQYVHGPLRNAAGSMPVLGVPTLTEALKRRLQHSSGGAFLVTGFRGVGKTSLVLRALDELATSDVFCDDELIPVVLNVAKPMTANELFYAIVRRLFEELERRGLFERFDQQVQRALLQAYLRTSLTVKETRSDSLEQAAAIGVGGGRPAGSAPSSAVNALVPKLNLSRKRTRSLAFEASFLTYSTTDVEHDVLRILELLAPGLPVAKPAVARQVLGYLLWPLGWHPAVRRWRRSAAYGPGTEGARPIRVVVVLDELDKLTATENGHAIVDELLTAAKNVLTSSGAHFLLIGGLDLYDKALRDTERGNSIFESVFGWRHYVLCMWEAPDALLDALVLESGSYDDKRELEWFRRYLRFKARGVTRRLLQEFNTFVTWDGDIPFLALDDAARKRIAFYGELEQILQDFFAAASRGNSPFLPRIDDDRWRMGSYYVTDWILRSKGQSFKVSEIVAAAELDPLFQISDEEVKRLVRHLIDKNLVEFDRRPGPGLTIIGDVSQAQEPSYRLTMRIYGLLHGFAQESESERAELEAFTPPAPPTDTATVFETLTDQSFTGIIGVTVDTYIGVDLAPQSPAVHYPRPLTSLRHGRYVLRRKVAQGAFGEVWSAYDNALRRKAAVKFIHGSIAENRTVRERFAREARITTGLDHPFIVGAFDFIDEPDGPLALVMEFVEGATLKETLASDPLPPKRAVGLSEQLLIALDYLHKRNIQRLDLKPSNIMIRPDSTPVIIDLGIARDDDASEFSTHEHIIIGTPANMAPEQIMGQQIDIRADLYALGLVVMEMLLGRPAQGTASEIFQRRISEEVDVTLAPGSDQLKTILAKALRRDPAERFATPAAMLEALRQVPEYTPPGSATLDTQQAPVGRALPKPPRAASSPPAVLAVRVHSGHGGPDRYLYNYELRLPNLDAHGPLESEYYADVGKVTADKLCTEIDELLQDASSSATDRLDKLTELGNFLYRMLFPFDHSRPSELGRRLGQLEGPLLVATNESTVPWELLHDGTDFLGLKHELGRRTVGDRGVARGRDIEGINRALIVGDPLGDLAAARQEASHLTGWLGRRGLDFTLLLGEQATHLTVMRELASGTYDLFHYCGHVGAPYKGTPGLVLHGHALLDEQTLHGLPSHAIPPIAFINGAGPTSRLTKLLREHGAKVLVGTRYAVEDHSALRFAERFYAGLLDGEAVGGAVREARQTLRWESLDWVSYILYGDPATRVTWKP